ncbi:hypothetical protein [Methylobacterium haplocladii]|uniref:Uncharacterized protein n=1 Tax=Methylobacterium haplocladii TaxID=1176176 RepID=A0A512IRB8_9HYPH|nr:hypothetical protein [Methylobacterium haplocladii]GEP00233.1 hypothetical protein MHA02_26200 [Methylobacterium haplocladii]GJD84259.1 hypothetical protein HPGCJGGD_2134 [Methylobacterium haplocladii]GLS61348.1 hypothetical protein GCM10007887_40550 [Methylobacterium haplocladii]
MPRSDITPEAAWRRFGASFSAAVAVLGLAAIGFVALFDPYGLRAAPGRPPGPLMDSNQRFLYPQIVRSGAYDAAVIGTSTARLLDPRDLDRAFGARFANLAMNAATPYEQSEVAALVLRHVRPKAMIFALDTTWCEAEADRRRLTFRPFPAWLYEDTANGGFMRQVNWRSLTIAGGVLLHRLGLAPERIRGDGFAVFTPPEWSYDAPRAAAHIHSGATALDDTDASETKAPASDGPMPALAWLDALLRKTPAEALKLVAFMPVNVAAQGRPGTPQGQREAACKAQVARIGEMRGATVVDFRYPSSVTTDDTNYWDALHYRLPVAGRIIGSLKAATQGGADDAGGVYRVLARP